MRILIDCSIPDAESLFAGLGTVTRFHGRTPSPELLATADALIVRSVTPVNASLLAETPVRFVGSATAGTDHIDIRSLADAGIHFAHAPGCNARPVAEYVFTAIHRLALSQRRDPYAMTLGVVGVGNVGSIVAQTADLLGMRVLVSDPPRERLGQLPAATPLNDLLSASDIVTLHVPLTLDGSDPTSNLIDGDRLRIAKHGQILINAARGGVLDEHAAASARQEGRLSGLVLDVWKGEPDLNPAMVQSADLATPHLAGYSRQSKERGARMIHREMASWMKGAGHPPGSPASSEDPVFALARRRHGIARFQVGASACSADLKPARPRIISPNGVSLARQVEPVLMNACPVAEADRELREAVASGTMNREFDFIRGRFAGRNEFPESIVPANLDADQDVHDALSALGFRMPQTVSS